MEKKPDLIRSLPHAPGVYLFYSDTAHVIYVGKAKDLYRRVSQYFENRSDRDEKTARLVSDIADINVIRTASEFDAIILEARLIRQHMPKYNLVLRDGKSPLYVVITAGEQLPKITVMRKANLPAHPGSADRIFGPFTSAGTLRSILRQIRTFIPYCTQTRRSGKPCFYTHLGLCSPCPSHISGLTDQAQFRKLSAEYRRNIKRIISLFDGKFTWLVRQYERDMAAYAKNLQFEEAAVVKQRLDSLYAVSEYRYDPAVFMERPVQAVYSQQLEEFGNRIQDVLGPIRSLHRIECYDMSVLSQTNAVGSMVVLTDGVSDTGQYRRFRIKKTGTVSDTDCMKEVLSRRFTHKEWPFPDFILVDGGKPQVSAAASVLSELRVTVPLAGLAKRREEVIIIRDGTLRTVRFPLSGQAIKVLQRIRDEAHRFALSYQRALRPKVV